MQFKKIKHAVTHDGRWVKAELYPLPASLCCYCEGCLNPLHFRITHAEGRFFEHDLENSDINRLEECPYLLLPHRPAQLSTVTRATALHESFHLGNPQPKHFICVMCDYEFFGLKHCPHCGNTLYCTEVKNRNTLTLSEKFAK
ncbi:putative zinc ribbon protein [Rahnella sp. ChDrAdgB13]|uniref:putative zinc ribbon protein n=1 Tax=Rahnella sp. ChDrAdgB13 TaxID=1850581 RepID=UPI001AD86FA8|nr:putative zinc ribbon protein [Rahnella sp. ChDrAdgB13]